MHSLDLTRQLLAFAHTSMDLRFEECPRERPFSYEAGSPVGSVGAIYAHAVISEDTTVSGMSGTPALFADEGWRAAFRFSPSAGMDIPWIESVRYDAAEFQAYAGRVFERTDAWLASLDEKDLERLANVWMVSKVQGKPRYTEAQKPLLYVFMDNVTLHVCEHTGEMAAAVGRMRAGLG